jgi:mannose-1-phosphate guanylyltransferase
MINVVLCGGNGTRLWPLSRTKYPKQFAKLLDNQSLFQKTLLRNKDICDELIIVSNEEQFYLANDQAEEIKANISRYILEPVGRNTAPAIALACYSLKEDDTVLVTPSDHYIHHLQEYYQSVREAEQLAHDGYIVTFGIKPSYPEVGFGYIESRGLDVVSFKEKPNLEVAAQYVRAGNYYWNSGMIVFKVRTMLSELNEHAKEILIKSRDAYNNSYQEKVINISLKDMRAIPSESIDYAVLEKSKKVKVIPVSYEWSDIGSFEAIYKEMPKDHQHNTLTNDVIAVESKENLFITSGRKIAAIDINNIIVVDTPDALLISKKGSSQKVKEVVQQLSETSPELCNEHLTTYRQWGHSTILDSEEKFKIKKIVVKPGQKLSLQKHLHRSEHWIVVKGTALISMGQTQKLLKTNESTFVPIGVEHIIENPGLTELVIVEVQVGDFLSEKDIVRYS